MDARRAVRHDLGSIGAALAARILSECEPAIDAEIRRLRPALRHTQGIDEDDLRSLGQIVALESYLTWEEGRGRTLRSWAGQNVRWRLGEAIRAAQSPEESRGASVASDEVVDPREGYDEAERLEWLQSAIGRLSPRRRVLVVSTLRGEQQHAVGSTLGIGRSRVCQEISVAVAALHEAAVHAGLVDALHEAAVDAGLEDG